MQPKREARYGDGASPFGFEDLDVYQVARDFRKRAYKLASRLPEAERYALAQQVRRAAYSLTANLAEGYGRHNWQEGTQFCRQARGSLLELVEAINVCEDEQYAPAEHLQGLKSEATRLLRLINGYISYLQRQKESGRRSTRSKDA